MKKKYLLLAVLFIPAISFADVTIGKVYGDKTWVAYIGSGNGIYLRRGSSDFASKCYTGFVSKGKYVSAPDGSSLTSKSSILTAIQRRLVRGKYKNSGCK